MSSPIGMALAKYLAKKDSLSVIGICSGRKILNAGEVDLKKIEVVYCDLRQSLPNTLVTRLRAVDFIFHLAWAREDRLDVARQVNETILLRLQAAKKAETSILFLSSVAASPITRSIYGSAKYHVMHHVCDPSAIVFICGLVRCDPPFGPHALLKTTVRRLPLRLRFRRPAPRVYSISMHKLLEELGAALDGAYAPGIYRQFEESKSINETLEELEPKRQFSCGTLTLNATSIVAICLVIRKFVPFATFFCDKIITFLSKDDEFLAQIQSK